MKRLSTYLVVAAIAAIIAVIVIALRASRAERSSLDSGERLPGSFDTWPEVPTKVESAA